MARLILLQEGEATTFELTEEETVIGRHPECTIQINSNMVSRKHAQVTNENGRYVIEDLGSANGSHLNNTRIQKSQLAHADVVQCGSLMIRFLDEGSVNAPGGVGPRPIVRAEIGSGDGAVEAPGARS